MTSSARRAVTTGDQKPPMSREIKTNFWMKPIPPREFDWTAWFDGDEPNDDGNMKCGYGRTEGDAIADLLSMEDE